VCVLGGLTTTVFVRMLFQELAVSFRSARGTRGGTHAYGAADAWKMTVPF